MLRRIIVGAVAAAALAVPAPAALADEPTYGCGYRLVETAASGAGQAVVWGYLAHAADTSATIRCSIVVNGNVAVTTDTGIVGPVKVVAGQGQFSAGDTDVVTLRAEICTSHGCVTKNSETTRTRIPPQEVLDLIFSLGDTLDATVCGVTAIIGDAGFNILGLVVIHEGGDVYVAGALVQDC